MTIMFGYMQLALVPPGLRASMEGRIRACAAESGGALERMYREPTPQVRVLWSLIEAMDRESGKDMVSGVASFAEQEGVDLSRVLAPVSSAREFWAMLGELERAGGGYIVAADPGHLDGLEVPKHVLLQRISEVRPAVGVLYANSEASNARLESPGGLISTARRAGVLAEIEVMALAAAEEVVLLSADTYLSRAGLSSLVHSVDLLLHELVGAAVRIAAADFAAEPNKMKVRLRCPTGATRLFVEVHESREHSDEPIPNVVNTIADQVGGRVIRFRPSGGGTATRCELPLPGVNALSDANYAEQGGMFGRYSDPAGTS